MRRLHIVLGLVLVLLAGSLPAHAQELAPIPPLDSPVIDTTGTLDPATEQALEAQARALQQRKGSQLQVLMVPTTGPEDIAQYAVRAYEQYRLGREKVDDGVLLVIAKDDRRARIEVGYGLEGAIPDAIAMRVIQEYLVPHFRQGDYAGGIGAATAALASLIDGEALPPPMAAQDVRRGDGIGSGWLFALVAAMIVAQFARAVLGRAPRPVRGIGAALAAGGIAWLLSWWLLGIVGGLIGLFFGFATASRGRVARHRHRGGFGYGAGIGTGIGLGGLGGFGGGGFGGGGFGGGWGGGGGMSGGGGASGGW